MKKLIPYLFLLFTLNSFSQTYFPFPDSVGIWRQSSVMVQQSSYFTYTNYALFINGDTTINNNLYSKIYYSNTPNNINSINSPYYGALREVNKKVYFHPDTTYNFGNGYNFCYESIWPNPLKFSEDLLLYDFNVNVGDTVFYPHLDSTYIIINSIDSVLIQGQYRKRYNYWQSNSLTCNGSGSGNNYVEGIGDITSGLLSLWIYYFENFEQLNCFEDDKVFYSNVPNCATVGIEERFNQNNIKVYPNPSSTNLFIELADFNASFKARLTLSDISGKLIYSSSINSATTTIDISAFKNGLYLLKITSEKGESVTNLISKF